MADRIESQGLDLAHPDELYENLDLDCERRDGCDENADEMDMVFMPAARISMASIRPRVLKAIPGMGKVFDWRGTGLLPPNGGHITPLIAVEHIPVYPNKPGYEDFIGLAAVLRAQGLSLQAATDRDGNVALYNPFDVLCYQARGANQISYGVEHMHVSVDEPWTKRQFRASAWIGQLAERKHGIPLGMANLEPGDGFVRVKRKGHTSHKNVSAKAGFNDRSDPGPLYDWDYVKHCAEFYKAHGHMEGA